jgi:hypothetical protein
MTLDSILPSCPAAQSVTGCIQIKDELITEGVEE